MRERINQGIIDDAVKARQLEYTSYGKMKAAEALSCCASVRKNAEEARKNGYMTVRERMKLKESNK